MSNMEFPATHQSSNATKLGPAELYADNSATDPCDSKAHRSPLSALCLIVITGRLLHGSMLGLLHRLRQGNTLAAASVRYPDLRPWAENSLASKPASAQRRFTIRLIDCGVSAFSSTASQRSMARKIGPLVMSARSSHSRSASTGGPTSSTLPASSACAGLGPAELNRHARQRRRIVGPGD